MTTSIYELFNKRAEAPTNPPPLTAAPTGGGSPYALAALRREAANVAGTSEGGRNHALNKAAFSVAQLVSAGQLDPQVAYDTLTEAAEHAGLDTTEIHRTLHSGYSAGEQKPRQIPDPPPPPPVTTITADPEHPTPDTTDSDGATASDKAGQMSHAEALELWREQTLAQEIERIRIRREADRYVTAEEHAKQWREPPWRPTLTEELAIPDEPVTYLIDDIFPTGGNVLLTAQYKTGKTTLVNDMARALADRNQFLGRFNTSMNEGRIALWNYEVDDRQYRRWLREAGFRNTDQVSVLNLRGYRMPVMVPRVEDWIVNWLIDRQVTTWVMDPFARAFVGSGTSENDNTEVGAFLDTLDVIKDRAGVSELILPTHTGRAEMDKGSERARGATRLDDWADVRWLLTKDDRDVRYFRATGRDVEFPEERLDYDEATRALTLGGGDRAWEMRRHRTQTVIEVVNDNPGIGLAALRTAVRSAGVKGRNDNIDAAINEAEYEHQIIVERGGSGSATRHFPARVTTIQAGAAS